jgi:hypothetical protein
VNRGERFPRAVSMVEQRVVEIKEDRAQHRPSRLEPSQPAC